MKQIFRFYKNEADKWYIDLPEWEGSLSELQMVEGADTMLDIVSNYTRECYLDISDAWFEGSDLIELTENMRESIGGGMYVMRTHKGEPIEHPMWLCEVTVHVFDKLPEQIYIRKSE